MADPFAYLLGAWLRAGLAKTARRWFKQVRWAGWGSTIRLRWRGDRDAVLKSSSRLLALPAGRIGRFDNAGGRGRLCYLGACLCSSVAFE
jgi:hypothetical protein